MRKIIIFCLFLTACATPAQAAVMAPRGAETAQEATITASPAFEPSTTPNWAATQAETDRQLQDAITAKLVAQMNEQNAIATAQAGQLEILQITQVAEIRSATQTPYSVSVTETAQVLDLTKQAESNRATETAREQMVKVLDSQANYSRSLIEKQNAASQNALTWAVAGFVALLVLVVIFRVVSDLWRKVKNAQAETDEYQTEQTGGNLPQNVRAYPGNINLKLFTDVHFTLSELQKIAVGLQDGKPFTYDNFTPSENGMSDQRFQSLQYLLVKYGGAVWREETHKAGAELTDRGRQFFADLLTEAAPPPPKLAPITPESDGYRAIDTKNGLGE